MEIKYIPASPSNYTSGRQQKISRITCHHTGGHITAEQCGKIFQSPNRGASAHYGIGYDGEVAQYVKESDTAWSDGNWDSNCKTVSIECANSSTGGDWPISDATWNTLVELVRDIATRNGLLPLKVGTSLIGHKDAGTPTICPGPYLYARLQELADTVNNGQPSVSQPSPQTPEPERKDLNAIADEVIAGKWGNGEDRFSRLREAGYDPDTVQAIVNAKMGVVSAPETNQNLEEVARAVIRGDYGNGDERVKKLEEAGYNYDEVQTVVNDLLGYLPQEAPHQPGPASIPIKEGDLVVPVDWVDYNGTPLAKTRSFYYVSELSNGRAVLRADGMSGPVYAAVRTNNLRKA